MIDLRFKEMPSAIEVGGITYALKTDFREWLQFGYMLEHDHQLWAGVFSDEVPSADWSEEIIEFYLSENVTPKREMPSDRKLLDYILDGDYIVASFQSAYGIDLTTIDYMHWHRFKALIAGLPKNAKLSEIMGYRAWKKQGKYDHDREMEKLERAWRLPDIHEDERREAVLQWADSVMR